MVLLLFMIRCYRVGLSGWVQKTIRHCSLLAASIKSTLLLPEPRKLLSITRMLLYFWRLNVTQGCVNKLEGVAEHIIASISVYFEKEPQVHF